MAYRYGMGVRKNVKKGFALELHAAKMGEREAPVLLVERVSVGAKALLLTPKNASGRYLRAARRGHGDAAHNVAYFYETGRGVRQNKKKAEFWYARAKQ